MEIYRAPNGRLYFYNKDTGDATWDRPGGVVGDQAVNDIQSWECYLDVHGNKYFYNVISGETSWETPPGCKGSIIIIKCHGRSLGLGLLCLERIQMLQNRPVRKRILS
mmetsp:Transcript_17517/g.27336  ORF Transcript_17517/g.27336 Transcript_17517/m.27336 type:complete len:108 (-) Transcript_17517:1489-1812(-)